jgi:uncharacterized protein YbjT (DUF2867 family)
MSIRHISAKHCVSVPSACGIIVHISVNQSYASISCNLLLYTEILSIYLPSSIMPDKTVLVMRATGVQGKGTISHLVRTGWHIRALVADLASDRAIALKSFGEQVTLYQGTWKDPPTIEAALNGCQALLFNQLPSFADDDAETQEAHVVLELAKAAGVQHVVFPSSVFLNNPNAREDLKSLIAAPAVLNKGDVEELIKSSGITWTFLRPGYFNTNLLPPLVHWMFPEMKQGRMVNSYGPDCIITLVDPDDIGAFAAAAFNNPAKFGGQTITVVSENMRFDDMMEEFSKACGHQFEIVYRTEEETKSQMDNVFVAGHVMCHGVEKLVNMEEIRKWGIPLTSFKQFLEKHKQDLPKGSLSENGSTAEPFLVSQMTGSK